MNNETNDEVLQPIRDAAEEKKEEIRDNIADFKDTVEFAKNDIAESAGKIAEAADNKHEEIVTHINESLEDAKYQRDQASAELLEKADALAAETEAKQEELKSEIKDWAENVKETAQEKKDEIVSDINDYRDKAHDMGEAAAFTFMMKADDAAAKVDEHQEEIRSGIQENLDDFKEKLNSTEEKIDEKVEKQAEMIDEKKEEFFEKAHETNENVKTDVQETIENVRDTIQSPEDKLEELPVTRHEPSIPKYVPKSEHTRESPDAPISDENSIYYRDDKLEMVENGNVKGTVNNGQKSNDNTVLWIIIAVLFALIAAGCCIFSIFFGIFRVMLG